MSAQIGKKKSLMCNKIINSLQPALVIHKDKRDNRCLVFLILLQHKADGDGPFTVLYHIKLQNDYLVISQQGQVQICLLQFLFLLL